MTAAVLVVVAVLALLVAVTRRSGARSPSNEVGRFAAARDVTNRWSADPGSTPRPLRDYLSEQRSIAGDPEDPA